MLKVAIYMQESGGCSTIVAPYEVFNHTGVAWNYMVGETMEQQFKVYLTTIDGKPAKLQFGMEIKADCSIFDLEDVDIIIVSSGGPDVKASVAKQRDVIEWLKQMHKKGTVLGSVCTGFALLAETGLLKGKKATTHWGSIEKLERAYPDIELVHDELFVEQGRIITAGGNYAGNDVALHLVEKFCGETMKRNVASALVLDTRRPNQASYAGIIQYRIHKDEKIHTIQDWLDQNYSKEIQLDQVALSHGMSPRTFHRRFKKATGNTSLNYLQCLRIEAAKLMLESTDQQVSQIVHKIGYRDENHFRRLFRDQTGFSPLSWRDRYAATLSIQG